MKDQTKNPTHMVLNFHPPEGGKTLVLKIPAVWDERGQTWIGAIKLPKSKKVLHICGANSYELQLNFAWMVSKVVEEETLKKELWSLLEEKK